MQGNRNWIGGIEYMKNMVLALNSLPPDVQSTFELSLLSDRSLEEHLYRPILPYVKNLFFTENMPPQSLVSKAHRIIRRVLSGNNEYRFHSFFKSQDFDFVYPFYFEKILSKTYRCAAWIPDFQHKYLPHFFSDNEIRKRDLSFERTATHAPTIILSSKTAETDFHTYFPQSMHKTKVLSFTTCPDPTWYDPDPKEIQKKYSLPDQFFLICNQFWKHKNHLTVFRAMHHLRKLSIRPAIVCTGNIEDTRDKAYAGLIQRTIDELGLRDQIHILGLIPRIDQIQLIRRSMAVLQPSLFEGWSTVVEDARCLGKHILISDIPVHKEQNPPHSIFFNPDSPEELSQYLAQWWGELSPGENLKREQEARQAAIAAVTSYGYKILAIARGSS